MSNASAATRHMRGRRRRMGMRPMRAVGRAFQAQRSIPAQPAVHRLTAPPRTGRPPRSPVGIVRVVDGVSYMITPQPSPEPCSYPVPGPRLPQRVRADLADQRTGRGVLVHPSGFPVPVAGVVQPARAAVLPGGRVLRRQQRHSVDQVRHGRRQARDHDSAPAPPGWHWSVRCRGDRRGAGVPTGVGRDRGQDFHRHAARGSKATR